MAPVRQWLFAPFRLDLDSACLWRETRVVALKPKPFAVLQYLVEHAGRLVTKEEIFDAVWPSTAVGDAVLKVCIGELRKALGETAQTAQCIATVHRRGYRFIAPVTPVSLAPAAPGPAQNPGASPPVPVLRSLDGAPASPPVASAPPRPLVGRELILYQLHAWLAQAAQGHRHVVLVTGEPGIGKTTVVEAFTAQAVATAPVRLAWGQCIAQYGAGEPYLPVLEALGQLCRGPEGPEVVAVLRQQAPTWLVQMPWLFTAADRERLSQELQGITRERMLREFAELVETLTVATPLILVLEDLHWSDHATLDLVARLARRRLPARLLLLGTYRPVELIMQHHLRTVAQDLQLHGQGTVLPLPLLDVEAVAAYLAARLPGQSMPETLAIWLHQHTDGNPLFLGAMVRTLMERGILKEGDGGWTLTGELDTSVLGVPEGLRPMLEQQIACLPLELQQVLEVASVAGVGFATAAVAAGTAQDLGPIEAHCEELARQHLVRPAGLVTWPDGTAATRYEFTHALYQQETYERIGMGRKTSLHRRVGARLETAYGARASEMAAELAVHFDRGRDYARAVQYLQQAGENAMRRWAHQEAIAYLTRGLALLETLPDTPARAQQELTLLIALGTPLLAVKGYASPERRHACTRAWELCQQLGETPHHFPVLFALWQCYALGAEWQTARAMGEQLLRLATHQRNPDLLLEAHRAMGYVLLCCGEFAAARAHTEQGRALYAPQQHHTHALLYGQDPGMCCCIYTAAALWMLGYPGQALARGREALTIARERAHPFSVAMALSETAIIHQYCGEVHRTHEHADAVMALSTEQQFAVRLAEGTMLQGWVRTVQGEVEEGIMQLSQGLAAFHATGIENVRPYYLALLAEAQGKAGRVEEGLSTLTTALTLVDQTGERFYAAELYRLQGELLLQRAVTDTQQAEACVHQALNIARQQQARSWELRAAMSLARLWQQQGKRGAARRLLAEIYHWFTEGFDTADLKTAKALLEELSG